MIYLNHAATTYPKPQCVLTAHAAAFNALPGAQFRSSLWDGMDVFEECRKKTGALFKIKETDRIYFSSGATDSLNALLSGLDFSGKQIITTATEHNSVLRALYNLDTFKNDSMFPDPVFIKGYPVCQKESKIVIVPCDREGYVSPGDIEKAITPLTKAIIVNHCSNVTGMVQDMEAIGEIAKKHQLLFIADLSQSAGALPVKADEWGISALAFTGHKSMYGLQGTGGYYVRSGISFKPFRYGGTGRDSKKLIYKEGEYEFEPGTRNFYGIAALCAGISYLLERDVMKIMKKEQDLMARLYDGLSRKQAVTIYGSKERNKGPLLSFTIQGMKPSDIGYILQNGYEMVVRTGMHCAPLIHHHMGTAELGTVRVSISDFTTRQEIEAFLEAVGDICNSI